MIKLNYILFLLFLFGCKHPESNDYNRYKDMEILMAVIRETEDNGLEAKQLKVVVDKPH